jgi:uncharacterized cupredoxin-like copper-binding protein
MTRRTVAALAAALTAAFACQPAEDGSGAEPGVVEVTARDFEFEAPREIPSGWTTLRLANEGEQDHFLYLYRLPDDVSFAEYRRTVPKTFSEIYSRYDAGELTRAEAEAALGEQIPGWFFTDVVPVGGVALVDAGRSAEATVRLEPGTYVMECYVKTPGNTWHTDRGMLRELTVTGDSTGARPPAADVEVTLSNYEFEVRGELDAGEHTIAVHAADRPEGMLMHDANLVRLDGGTSVDSVAAWMDWMELEQFRHPAPGTNLGGVEHMAPGRTGYMTVTLEPGRYAWVSEGYASEGMVREFTVE